MQPSDVKCREDLATLFGEMGYKTGAEIGVLRGGYSHLMCERNPGVKLYCIDPWTACRGGTQSHQDRNYARTVARLSAFNATVLRMTSMAAVSSFAPSSLDFVYIDGAHDFDNVMLDLILWSPKVRSGGIVAGHDYDKHPLHGVIEAVGPFLDNHPGRTLYVTEEPPRSFFWIQP